MDDSSLWEACHSSVSDSQLQEAAGQASAWTEKKDNEASTDKPKYIEIYFGTVPLILHHFVIINGSDIDQVTIFKLLGFLIADKLSWNEHVEYSVVKDQRDQSLISMHGLCGIQF